MNNINSAPSTPRSNRGTLTTGLILIVIGLALLLRHLVDLDAVFFLVFGLAMLLGGSISRQVGWIIPGGIVSGIGLGIAVLEFNPYQVGEEAEGSLFLLSFALGWFAVALFSKLFTRHTQWWALIPGGIMALIGGLILAGEQGLAVLELLGMYWPVILILVGLLMLVGWMRSSRA